ncbi:MAG: GNAT family N-acetyltransferase [Candidatus Aenigmarchaeota archaeon]|nr:GNAT family N-acetyltransferase [Candidatus Aenigmarchaeota archaeon]
MKIRFATINDKKACLKILDELGTEVKQKRGVEKISTEAQRIGGKIFNEIIKRKDTKIFVAEEKGKIIGLATFYLLPNIRHGWHRGHIEDFIVHKEERNKGVGSSLMNYIKDYCKKNKVKVVKLDSGLELRNAHLFYEKHGGKHTEKMYRFDIDYS